MITTLGRVSRSMMALDEFPWPYIENKIIFVQENVSENAVYTMAIVSYKSHECVNCRRCLFMGSNFRVHRERISCWWNTNRVSYNLRRFFLSRNNPLDDIFFWCHHITIENEIDIYMNICFEVKLTLIILTVRGKQHSFSTHERLFLWKCQSFWDRKCLDLRGLEPPTFGFMPNAVTYWAIRARHLLAYGFEHWLWRNRYFWNKVSIWNDNCARATAFTFDTRTVVLVIVSKIWERKCLYLTGTRTPNLRIHAEHSNLLSYHGGTFAVPWFWTIGTATKISRRIPLLRKDVMRSCWILNVLFLATGHISKFIEEYF